MRRSRSGGWVRAEVKRPETRHQDEIHSPDEVREWDLSEGTAGVIEWSEGDGRDA